MGQDLSKALHVPEMDAPVAALAAPSIMANAPEEALRAEDKRAERSLRKALQAAAWAVKASTAASFFNRASLLAATDAGEDSCRRHKISLGHK